MPSDLIAPMAVLPLTFGSEIVAEALDPTTFAPVAGVTVTAFTIYAIDSGADAGNAPVPGPYILVPGGNA